MSLSQILPNLSSRTMYPTVYHIPLLRYPLELSRSCPQNKLTISSFQFFSGYFLSQWMRASLSYLITQTRTMEVICGFSFYLTASLWSMFASCWFSLLNISQTPSILSIHFAIVLVQVIIHFCLESSFRILTFLLGPHLAPPQSILHVPARAIFLKHQAVPIGQSRSLHETIHILPVATQPVLWSFPCWV